MSRPDLPQGDRRAPLHTSTSPQRLRFLISCVACSSGATRVGDRKLMRAFLLQIVGPRLGTSSLTSLPLPTLNSVSRARGGGEEEKTRFKDGGIQGKKSLWIGKRNGKMIWQSGKWWGLEAKEIGEQLKRSIDPLKRELGDEICITRGNCSNVRVGDTLLSNAVEKPRFEQCQNLKKGTTNAHRNRPLLSPSKSLRVNRLWSFSHHNQLKTKIHNEDVLLHVF